MLSIWLVNKALAVFEKTRTRLINAINACIDEIDDRKNKTAKINSEITDIECAQERAKKVLAALDKILEA